MPTINEICPSKAEQILLFENGKSDRQHNITKHDGWVEICENFGWNPLGRTPARECYEDGYYSVT